MSWPGYPFEFDTNLTTKNLLYHVNSNFHKTVYYRPFNAAMICMHLLTSTVTETKINENCTQIHNRDDYVYRQ